jgi:hypothetical protein
MLFLMRMARKKENGSDGAKSVVAIMPAIASQGIGVKEAFASVMGWLFPSFQIAS